MIYAVFTILTLLILGFAFYQWQYYLLFAPTYHREEKLCVKCSLLDATAEDGVTLEGVVYEPEDAVATLLLFLGRHHDAVGVINKFASTYPSCRIIAFNYRAYGKSEGSLSEINLLSDALHIAGLVQKNYGDFYTLGYSLGSTPAAYVAMHCKVKGLFLVGAFDSVASLAKEIYPFGDKLFRYKFPTDAYLQKVNSPTYIFASVDDERVPFSHTKKLIKKAANLKEYVELSGLDHKEILWDTRVTEVIKRVTSS